MFEIVTTNGFRRSIKREAIMCIGELRNNGKSNTVLTLVNGETVFADEKYDDVISLYRGSE